MSIAHEPSSVTVKLSGAALRTFHKIGDSWHLKTGQRRALLGNIPAATFHRMQSEPEHAQLSSDTLERISHILAIYKALHVLFPSDDYADRWISEPNAAFGGASARDKMLESFASLVHVRQYLDAERGW